MVKSALIRLEQDFAGGIPASSFLPSKVFQGKKPGYYFGTAAGATGYYADARQKAAPSSADTRARPCSAFIFGCVRIFCILHIFSKLRLSQVEEPPPGKKPAPRVDANKLLEEAEKETEVDVRSRRASPSPRLCRQRVRSPAIRAKTLLSRRLPFRSDPPRCAAAPPLAARPRSPCAPTASLCAVRLTHSAPRPPFPPPFPLRWRWSTSKP